MAELSLPEGASPEGGGLAAKLGAEICLDAQSADQGPSPEGSGLAAKLGAESCLDAQSADQAQADGDMPLAAEPQADTEGKGETMSGIAADGSPAGPGACPLRLCIAASGNEKLDGTYELHSEASDGKPAYGKQREGKKPIYLYHANKKWMLGVEFGSSKKMFASVKAATRCRTPCEPYPFMWMLHAEGEKTEVPCMRVMDVCGTESASFAALPAEPFCDDALRSTRKPGSTRGPGRPKKRPRTDAKTSVQAVAKLATETETSFAEALGMAAQEAPAADDAQNESEESDSESSDSSSSSASQTPSVAPAGRVWHTALAPSVSLLAKAGEPAPSMKMVLFEKRIRASLHKFSPQDSLVKIEMMVKNPEKFVKTSGGLTVEEIRAFSTALKAECLDGRFPILTEKPMAPPASNAASLKVAGAVPSPFGKPASKPVSKIELPHKTLPHPAKSSLKGKWVARRPGRGFVQVHGIAQGAEPGSKDRLVGITSWKEFSEALWYKNPGSAVLCDQCGGRGPQTLGALQGPPGAPQAVAEQFVCNSCLGVY